MKRKNIAGMSIRGGRRDNFYLCLFEYYDETDRWFLGSLLPVKDEDEGEIEGDDVIRKWATKYELQELVVDTPLSFPACEKCALACPGAKRCPEVAIREVKRKIDMLLLDDQRLMESDPKNYERERNDDDLIDFSKNILSKSSHEHILSRSFKRRLRKGFLPYWNRPIDFWVWLFYYDVLLKTFNLSYDSFGSTSLMLISRFNYLRRHFPEALKLYEGNTYLTLIELLRSKVVTRTQLHALLDLDNAPAARLDIIKSIETHFNLFIYDHDLELLVKDIRAFDSFLLALTGKRLHVGKVRELPAWSNPSETNFTVPIF